VDVAKLFEERYGHEMDENSARDFTAALTLLQAIDEAGSTEPEAIREALAGLEVAGDETIMPWDGIRFDDTGQNELARGVILQYLDGEYKLVWPFDAATAELVWPLPPFEKR
jgi:branched-chain amino acid transport system substrate-binding protein